MAEEGVTVSVSAILLFVMFVMFLLAFIFPGFRNWISTLVVYIQTLVMAIINKIAPWASWI